MTAPSREIELKFVVDRSQVAALLEALPPGDTVIKDLVAVYFDTPDLDLAKGGYGLRVRRSGDQSIQTLKSSLGEDGGRDEWEWPVEGDTPDRVLLASTPAPLPSDAPLVPLFTVRSRRTVRVVDVAGARVEAVIDDAVVEAEDRAYPFLELELELLEGDPAALRALADRLATVVELVPSAMTKAERGYRLAGHI